jgi:hypothetical protein
VRYDVTYLISSERRADRVEAQDAAAAVATVHATAGHVAGSFELLSVLLLDERLTPPIVGSAERAPAP